MRICSAFPGFLLSENKPLLVQGDSLVPSISLYQCIPLPLSVWKSGSWGSAAAIIKSPRFQYSALSIPGLEKKACPPSACPPSSPYEHTQCIRTDTVHCKDRFLS